MTAVSWIAGELVPATHEADVLELIVDVAGLEIIPVDGGTSNDQLGARVPRVVATYAVNLRTAQRAVADLEGRYLGGHPALFPDLAQKQQRLLDHLAELVDHAQAIHELSIQGHATDDLGPHELAAGALSGAFAAGPPLIAAMRSVEARIMSFELLGQPSEATALRARLVRRAADSGIGRVGR